jgi:hypothetical protein
MKLMSMMLLVFLLLLPSLLVTRIPADIRFLQFLMLLVPLVAVIFFIECAPVVAVASPCFDVIPTHFCAASLLFLVLQ